MPPAKIDDFPEVKQILDRLKFGRPHETLCLFVPSHDRDGKEINEKQATWASKALALFGRLFGGATAFKFCEGVYHPKDLKKPLFDSPVMVQTLTGRDRVENQISLLELSEFCQELGRDMNQVAVGLVVNNYFVDIRPSTKRKGKD